MSFPYLEVFLALLLVYMAYSVWADLDARYPIAAALALLVITAIVDALGNVAAANTLAEYVFFLLGAGVLLLLIDHIRASRRRPIGSEDLGRSSEGETAKATQPRKGTTDEMLNGVQQQPVAVVDTAGHQDQYYKEDRDSEADWHEE